MRAVSFAMLIAAIFCGCTDEAQVTQPALAELALDADAAPRYHVEIIRTTLGGSNSRGNAISPRGWIAGFSNLAGNGARHAALWRDGSITDLETLGGTSSAVIWPGLNNAGLVAGISHIAELDTLNEAWSCEAGGFLPATTPRQVCRGFVWQDDVMHELPTLGGTHGFATGVNNRGQVVGWAETTLRDPTCTGVQVLGFRAVLWEPRKGTVRELPPLHGDSASAATDINERGQVVGISGDCDQAVGRFTARHGVIWEKGKPRRVPDLGGTSWHTPQDINQRGDVVGFSNPPSERDRQGIFRARGFLWTYGSNEAVDLGVLEGDSLSQAQAINSRRDVVGVSFGGTVGLRAFLWRDGTIMDLNVLAGPGFGPGQPYQLRSARDINDVGQITGDVLEASTNQIFTYVATPVTARPRSMQP
jgi:probable HAF family extracellular repeat protein